MLGLAQARKEAIGPLLGQKADHWRRVSPPNKANEHLQERSEAKAGRVDIQSKGQQPFLSKIAYLTRSQSSGEESEVLVEDMPSRGWDGVQIGDCIRVV